MGQHSDTCKGGFNLRCMHSEETIKLLLAHNPRMYTISEIASITDFHRNTTKNTICQLDNVRSLGKGNYKKYFMRTVSDHYRNIAYSFINSIRGVDGLDEWRLFEFGFSLVESNLRGIITQEYVDNYRHNSMAEALMHLKMGYPFIDLTVNEETNEVEISTQFSIKKDEVEGHILTLNPCLCNYSGNESYCKIAAGALTASMKYACQYNAKITHLESTPDGCVFVIKELSRVAAIPPAVIDDLIDAAEAIDLV